MISLAHDLKESRRLLERARKVIPGASQTLSKGPDQWVSSAPNFIDHGSGPFVWDVDGRQYLDLGGALGPVVLGYRHPVVDNAIMRQLGKGITFSLPTALEADVAERVTRMVPGAEQVRFAKTGSDATSAAVRLARIHTGREHVIATGYHGCSDWYHASSAYREGVPEALHGLITAVPLAHLRNLEGALRRHPTAAVILEPAGVTVPTREHLQAVIDLAHEHGALVIFDEVITGFRVAPGGAQEHFGVQADLACFGKALGNGMPISAVTGREELMRNAMWMSFTHAGEALSLAAARATLDVLDTSAVYLKLRWLGERLRDGINRAIDAHGLDEWVSCSGVAPRTIVTVREPDSKDGLLPAKSLLQQELVRRGVLWNGNNFIMCTMIADDIDMAVDVYDEALGVLATALPDDVGAYLDGPPIRAVFWQHTR